MEDLRNRGMARFLAVIGGFLLFIAFLMFLIPCRIDPYNVFHADRIRDNGVEPNKNYIKMRHVLKTAGQYDALLFGSSRVGAIHVEEIPGKSCYNLAYSEGTPAEHLQNIQTLIDAHIPVKTIYIGVDSLSYTIDPADHETDLIRMSYEKALHDPIHFWWGYLNIRSALSSLSVTRENTPTSGFSDYFYQYGEYFDYGWKDTVYWNKEGTQPAVGTAFRLEETLEEIRRIKELCRENGIETVFFTNPMCELTYDASLELSYREFLRGLARITDFYNFSGRNDVAVYNGLFVDASHYIPEVGELMIQAMCGEVPDETLYEQGFGVLVTEASAEEFLERYITASDGGQ